MGIPDDICGLCYCPKDDARDCGRADCEESLCWKLRNTESVSAMSEAADEIDKLRAFARGVLAGWPDWDLDGADIQGLAVKHGLLTPETRHRPCGDADRCQCREYLDDDDFERGATCHRKAPWLLTPNVELRGAHDEA